MLSPLLRSSFRFFETYILRPKDPGQNPRLVTPFPPLQPDSDSTLGLRLPAFLQEGGSVAGRLHLEEGEVGGYARGAWGAMLKDIETVQSSQRQTSPITTNIQQPSPTSRGSFFEVRVDLKVVSDGDMFRAVQSQGMSSIN